MYLYGASGHGKVIKEILESQGRQVDGFIDDNPEVTELAGLPVQHSMEDVDEVIVSIGVNQTRKKVVEKIHAKIAKPAIHEKAVVSPSAQIGEGTVVMAGAVINADAKIGKHCIINTEASVDHDCVIGDYVHIAPGAHICGGVHIGEGTLVGVGVSVIPCQHIGQWSIIGAGAAVVSDIPDGVVAVGVPAKVR